VYKLDIEISRDSYGKIKNIIGVPKFKMIILRIYNRIGLLKPSSINGESGYRYYSPKQISCLEIILNLKKIGFSLNEISQFVNAEVNNSEIVTIFQNKLTQLQSTLDTVQYNIELIEDMISSLKQGALIHDQLTGQHKAILLSRITCLGNEKLEECKW
jgi:DNA-binding transcriptional MerR regulator